MKRKVQENNWLIEGILYETAKMLSLWDLLITKGVQRDNHEMLIDWKEQFKAILQGLTKVNDEMEDLLMQCYYEDYGYWLYEEINKAVVQDHRM